MAKRAPLLALLGSPAIVDEHGSHPLRVSEKALALLVLLVCQAQRPLSRSWLASMLWPDVDEAEARTNLRRHFYLLAKALPGGQDDCITLTRGTAQWNARGAYRCDVIEFTAAVEVRDGERAVELYGGPLCMGNFDDLVLEERERLQRLYTDMLQEQIEAARASNDRPKAIALLERLTAQDPLNESWVCALAQARLQAGDRAGARRELTALVLRLRAELGVEPDAQTADMLEQCMEAADAAAATNLPVESDSFVGREAAMDELRGVLRSHKWVTIAGPGGVGKTRLAIHTARSHMSEFEDGVWFVDLSASTTWEHALRTIAATLGLSNDPQAALTMHLRAQRILLVLDNLEQITGDYAGAIEEFAGAGESRILATSRRRVGGACEHVYALDHLAVPDAIAVPAQALTFAGVRLFVERAMTVAPSFALSHENAAHVISIVSRLDGLPLAIELVAARANLLTIEGIAKRLHDLEAFRHKNRSSRHQTVSAALRWSYDLLSAREQLLLQRLAVFAGPFDLNAIEAICGDRAELSPSQIFPVLSELVEASLVVSRRSDQGDQQRYMLLETVRQFLRALADNAAESLQNAYAEYYADFVDRLSVYSEGARESEYYDAIDQEYVNVRAALDTAQRGDFAAAVRMVGALYRYWVMRGRLREGWQDACACEAPERLSSLPAEQQGRFYQAHGILARELGEREISERSLELALQRFVECANERRQCDILFAQAKLAYNSGQERRALSLYRQCIDLMQRFGDAHGRAGAIANVGTISHHFGDFEEAGRMYVLALEEYRRLGYLRGLAYIYRQLSLLRQNQGRYDEAIDLAKHSIAISVEIGELDREADAHVIHAGALMDARREREAFPSLVRALEILERSENAQFLMLAVEGLATAVYLVGDSVEAVRLSAFAERTRRLSDLALGYNYSRDILSRVNDLRRRLSKEQFAAAWAAGEALTPSAILAVARKFEDVSRTIRPL